jgi:hypothetical protein
LGFSGAPGGQIRDKSVAILIFSCARKTIEMPDSDFPQLQTVIIAFSEGDSKSDTVRVTVREAVWCRKSFMLKL